MIAFLNGTVAAVLPPQTAYIDVAGVGYAVAMPGGDLGKLAVGEEARVLTYLSVTENGIALFGFLSEEEKVLFEKLIGVGYVREMILAGATAVSVGTANFTNPHVTEEIVAGIRDYMERYQVADIRDLVGAVHE